MIWVFKNDQDSCPICKTKIFDDDKDEDFLKRAKNLTKEQLRREAYDDIAYKASEFKDAMKRETLYPEQYNTPHDSEDDSEPPELDEKTRQRLQAILAGMDIDIAEAKPTKSAKLETFGAYNFPSSIHQTPSKKSELYKEALLSWETLSADDRIANKVRKILSKNKNKLQNVTNK